MKMSRKAHMERRIKKISNHVNLIKRPEPLYKFRNNTGVDLVLSIPDANGKKHIEPHGEWVGDDRYMDMVRLTNEALFVGKLTPDEPEKVELLVETIKKEEKQMSDEKLILDQPETVTTHGKIEHVVAKTTPVKPLNENDPNEKKEILLTEDPIDGLEILID